ncbi:very short patch repair endonuclease [Flavobacterium aestivum]|uniref:very short patch repair endonuclease n=1 Tax=Flavobacterium aestivum TaxID=3003257 RepID=UPI002483165A|nr:DNA mismatch endonuclease Vsr [Flavobacterium aestivum]
MTDVHSKYTRSYNMSKIRNKNTKPEILVRKFIFSKGLRFRLHDKKLPGTPDIVLPKYKTVIFVNGCFWHGHKDCKYFVIPKTRTDWWLEKINRNIEKDIENKKKLMNIDWNVITIWECELKPLIKEITLYNIIEKLKIKC